MSSLDERTTIPLFTVLATLPVAIAGILWLTSIDAKANRALEIIDERGPIIQKTYEAVIRIEEQLKKSDNKNRK